LTKYSISRCLSGFLISGYIILSGASLLFGEAVYRFAAVGIGCFLFAMMLIVRRSTSFLYIFLIISLPLGIGFLNADWSDLRSVFLIFIIFSCFGISWAAFEFNLTKLAFEYIFLFILFLTFTLIFFFDFSYKEFNVFLIGSSRNVYSAFFLASAIGYTLSRLYRCKRPSILLLMLFVYLSFQLYGRSSIAFSIIFLLATMLFYFKKISILIFLICAILVSLSAFFMELQLSEYFSDTNFQSGLESGRYEMIWQYWDNLQASGLVFGQDFTWYPVIFDHDGNPHNAFLRLHGYWGLGLIFILATFFVSQYFAVRDQKTLIAFISLIVLTRAFLDIFYLFNLFDYLFFPAIFYVFYRPYFRRQAIQNK